MKNNDRELDLERGKKEHHDTIVPANIDVYIKKGILEGKRRKKNQMKKKILTLVASFLLISFITTIRVSPTFATAIGNIPGFEHIVSLIQFDRGLQQALENDFIQHIGLSDEQEGIIFTVEDIIIDEVSMILFYSIQTTGDHRFLNLGDVEFLNTNGENLTASYTIPHFIDEDLQVNPKLIGNIDLKFGEEVDIPEKILMKVSMKEAKETTDEYRRLVNEDLQNREKKLDSTWEVLFPVDVEMFAGMKEVYGINEIVIIDGQKIHFKELTLYPTRIALEVEYDPENTKKIFSFYNLKILDEEGRETGSRNGISASYINENALKIYMQSNYFNKPQKLYIEAEGIMALEKDQLEVVVDLENEKVIAAPETLNFLGFDKRNYVDEDRKSLVFEFMLKIKDEKHIRYPSFDHTIIDAVGTEYLALGIGGSNVRDNIVESYVKLDPEVNYISPITLKINSYPNIILEPIKIKVK